MSKRKQKKLSTSGLIPIYAASALIPLIVYMKRIKIEGILYETGKGISDFGEFFSYYKSVAIIIAALIAVIFLVIKDRDKINIKKQIDFFPAFIYLLFVVISTVTAEHIQVALYGYTERYEGALVLASYIVICFYTSYYIDNEDSIKAVFTAMCVSCTIIGFIGIFQYFGNDIFQTSIGMKLILPQRYHAYAESLKFSYTEKIIYGTFNNPNYVGSYSSMLLFVSLGLFYYLKDIKNRIITGIIFCGSSFILWIGSMSRAGLVGGVIAIIVFTVMQFKNIFRNWKYTLPLIIYFIGIYTVLNVSSGGRVVTEFDRINPVKENIRIEERKSRLYVDEIKTDNNMLVIRTNTETFKILYADEGKLKFLDIDNNPIKSTYKNNVYAFQDDLYSKYKILAEDSDDEYLLNIETHPIRFKYNEEGFHKVTPAGGLTKIQNAEGISILKEREAFASGRGFIWSRTIPMIKNTIFKGYGPDTYTIYFPQWDLAGKINGLNDPNMIVDKPHNWYLQIAVSTGLISLLCVILLILMYIYNTIKAYIKTKNKEDAIFISAVFTAIISYCIAGFFNDSVVSVAPVFWVLLGSGIALNRKSKENENRNFSK
jgi:O-antigen ligase